MLSFHDLEQGGLVMLAIAAASVVGLAYVIYCLLILRRGVVLAPALVKLAESCPGGDASAQAIETCRRQGGPFAEILLTVLATRDIGQDEAEALVESAGRRAAHELSRGTLALEVVAAISPLLGLLGTVIGMYRVFHRIAEVGAKEVGALSGGISQALITTICGLIVAIPAYVAFTYFTRRVDDLVLEMERHAVGLMARLRNRVAAEE